MIQCLYTTTLEHKKPLTFILHTYNYYPKMILFLIPKKPHFTNKTIIHHNILQHHPYHKNHKHKHKTQMNIPSLIKTLLYDFTKNTCMILGSMRIKSYFITTMTKAMTRLLPYRRHLRCNITNLGVQWSWTLTTYHNTLITTISFTNKPYTTTRCTPGWHDLRWKKHNVFKQSKNTTSKIILTAKQ